MSMPLNEAFSDDFRRILSNYLLDYETTLLKDFIKYMNNQNQKSAIWKSWIQTNIKLDEQIATKNKLTVSQLHKLRKLRNGELLCPLQVPIYKGITCFVKLP